MNEILKILQLEEIFEVALRLRDVEAEVTAANKRRADYEAKFGRSYRSWSPHGPSDSLNARHGGTIKRVRTLLEALDEFNGWKFCTLVGTDRDVYCSRGMVNETTNEVRTIALSGPDAGKLVSVPDASAIPVRG